MNTNNPHYQTKDLGLWRILRRIKADFLCKVGQFYLYGVIGGSVLLFIQHEQAKDGLSHVYGYGFNGNGRLGVGHFRLDVYDTPEEIVQFRSKRFQSIYGADFIIALDDQHQIWTFGSNDHGQLGLGDLVDRCHPELVLTHIKKVCASQTHVLCLDNDGYCCTWGDNRYGQCSGNGRNTFAESSTTITCPYKINWIENNESAMDVSCSSEASLILTKTHIIYVFGRFGSIRVDYWSKLSPNSTINKICGVSDNFLMIIDQYPQTLVMRPRDQQRNLAIQETASGQISLKDCFGSLTHETRNIIFHHSENIFMIWNRVEKNIQQTNIDSIPDISTLITCYFTDIYGILPAHLVTPDAIKSLGTFNDESVADLCIKVYTYGHFTKKIFVQQQILREHSTFLREFCEENIEDDPDELCGKRLVIRKYSYQLMYSYIRFIYTAQPYPLLYLDNDIMAQFYEMAHHFRDERLIELIPQLLLNRCQ